MNSIEPVKTAPRFRKRYLVILAVLLAGGLCVFGMTGYFRLGSETAALRRSLMKSVGGQWDTKIAVKLGGLTAGLVRIGLRCVHLAPEPRAAIEALRGVEVGVYNLAPGGARLTDRDGMLLATDKAMSARGWVRIVGVTREHELVAVYIPRKGVSAEKMRCCVMVLHEGTLVVASARGNLEPLLEIAKNRLNLREQNLALR